MAKRYVITLTAANRVGILAAVSNALTELGGDLLHISQTVVEKFFTMIIAADFPDSRTQDVVLDHIRAVCGPFSVDVTLKEPSQEQLPEDPEDGLLSYFLTIRGENQPGIVRLVSGRLAHDQIDIVNLEAVRVADGLEFLFNIEIATSSEIDVQQLQADLANLGQPSFEVSLRPFDDVREECRPVRAFLR